ncbi:PREDICTED: tetratricopeptide repeat protein 23 isoform X1 [Crocodylus porosus]|uniref:Tetratricopeptide repeat domain 23 n=1 Tax=Crocodylus porosus TaxID=8502 RepID=A0A7M4FLF0_CROPO|nr:PREDICTED: tetratricopeptide repeat protein 23 isoform X1 [Crocodylus porosus]XP_019389331.1 PREDICTED: tetratricopeptide repeat protein 23 isoform X1 [Crocodylus porosus]
MQQTQEVQTSGHTDSSTVTLSTELRNKIKNKSSETELLQPPSQKLLQCEQKANVHISNQEYKEALPELMTYLALARICYGDHHWKMAEAHVNLAQGYLQLQGFSLQAKQHAEKAKEILLASSLIPSSESEQRMDILQCSVAISHTLGRALTALHKLKDAERSLIKARKLSEELLQGQHVPPDKWIEIKAGIELSFAQLYQSQKKSKEALLCYQKALNYTEKSKGEDNLECVPIYKKIAGAAQILGDHDTAIQHLVKAHFIALRKSPSSVETANTAHLVARAAVASKKSDHNDLAEKYFQESINSFEEAEGTGSAKCLAAEDDFCQFLIDTGQQERAALMLKGSLEAKKATFGDLSPEVAETYWLLGVTELAQGHTNLAHKKLKKCLYLQTLLYGSHNKRTRATKETIDLLSKTPDVATEQRRTDEEKPPFPCSTTLGGGRD